MKEITLEEILHALYICQFTQKGEKPNIFGHNPEKQQFEILYPGTAEGALAGSVLFEYSLNERREITDVFYADDPEYYEHPDSYQAV